jgi:hypothetical protein
VPYAQLPSRDPIPCSACRIGQLCPTAFSDCGWDHAQGEEGPSLEQLFGVDDDDEEDVEYEPGMDEDPDDRRRRDSGDEREPSPPRPADNRQLLAQARACAQRGVALP